jgi:hypothetical protein
MKMISIFPTIKAPKIKRILYYKINNNLLKVIKIKAFILKINKKK